MNTLFSPRFQHIPNDFFNRFSRCTAFGIQRRMGSGVDFGAQVVGVVSHCLGVAFKKCVIKTAPTKARHMFYFCFLFVAIIFGAVILKISGCAIRNSSCLRIGRGLSSAHCETAWLQTLKYSANCVSVLKPRAVFTLVFVIFMFCILALLNLYCQAF